MTRSLPWLGIWVLVLPQLAAAQPRLLLPTGQSPHSLGMRGSAWKLAAQEPDEERSILALPTSDDLAGQKDLERFGSYELEQDALAPVAPLSDKVVFRFNLGMGIDDGDLSGAPSLSGTTIAEAAEAEALRVYSFADVVAGTRGLGVSGINTYFAAYARNNQSFAKEYSAVPSVYDGDLQKVLFRSAYGEIDEFFSMSALRPVYLRAGRQFEYGITPLHFDGLSLGYDRKGIKLNIFTGQRTDLYGVDTNSLDVDGIVSGGGVRIDLFELRRWPLVLFANTLLYEDHRHLRSGVALRWRRDILLSGSMRHINSSLARLSLSMRARLSEVTSLNLLLSSRRTSDWSYGLLMIEPSNDDNDPRRYLNIGRPLPRTHLGVRYGTVLLRNLDVHLRAAGALEHRGEDDEGATSFMSTYAEAGASAEVRVRRALRVGLSLSARRYFLEDDIGSIGAGDGELPSSLASTGVSSFRQGGVNFVYSSGARQFNASAELYGRSYQYRTEFNDKDLSELRTGGRFSIEGWALDRFRLKAEYDLTFGSLVMAPDIGGLKALRVLMEGSF